MEGVGKDRGRKKERKGREIGRRKIKKSGWKESEGRGAEGVGKWENTDN